MRLYRITKSKYAEDILGTGAWLKGGRWNSPGNAVCYTSSDFETALKEALGSGDPLERIRAVWSLVEIEVEGRSDIRMPRRESLPAEWDDIPYRIETQRFGDSIFREGALALRVPSARNQDGINYVLNPRHPAYAERVQVVAVRPMVEVLETL